VALTEFGKDIEKAASILQKGSIVYNLKQNEMNIQLLKGDNLIINKKEKIAKLYFLSILFGVFLSTINTYGQVESIQVGSTTREMIVSAPSGIEINRPLLIFCHGATSKIEDQEAVTKFGQIADANNFVLVYPQGIDGYWQLSGTEDIDFVLAIIDEMYERYNIDRDRVYLSGFSMGGMLSYYAATKIADKIAAFAPISGFLMSGPNTNSSRPIPLIHIHGEDDGFVPYSNVQTHLDAWIARNGCPTVQVTKPYPAGSTFSRATKYYWGPGADGVEIVLLTLGGIGHVYAIEPNAVDPGKEIWNFCKNFSLNNGIPKFMNASVTDNNPKQIQVTLSTAIIDSNYFNGFTVKINDLDITIDSVVLADSVKLVINLNDSIKKDNDITLSYSNGNVFSVYNMKSMVNFNDTLVDNLLNGSSPRIIEVTTNIDGDTLTIKFNKKMQIPSDFSALSLDAEYNGQVSIPILPGSFFNNDSTVLSLPLDEKVFRDYTLLFTYSGNNIISADTGLLKTVSAFPVKNNSNGLPVNINSANIGADGTSLLLKFSKPISLESVQSDYFTFYKNGEHVTLTKYSVADSTIKFILSNSVHYGDTLIISYTPGGVKAADNGLLVVFSDFTIGNTVNMPDWVRIPAKIEAENYSSQYGTQTEQTDDTGGGLNIGYFDNGDWLEYTIENNTSDTSYQITFRVSAPSSGAKISYYIDDKSAGQVNVPITRDWQVFKSVVGNIGISHGKHYLKVVATSAGFNLNYMDIHEVLTGISKESEANLTIYPNPASSEITISSGDFSHNKIEIFDIKGNLLISKATEGEPVLQVPVRLINGIYFVKISNETQYRLRKIEIVNK
jgi:uncharacterized repeat protein (TIGR02059 family)